jgi:tetratricopeptide (TPR) repeat protein
MGKIVLPLIVVSLVGLGPAEDVKIIVRRWIVAARAHHPGTIDQPLIDIATESPRNLEVVRRQLRPVLEADFDRAEPRNDILRRGALLHTDVALLLPEQAAAFTQSDDVPLVRPYFDPLASTRPRVRREADSLVVGVDGEYLATAAETAHWSMARGLLSGIKPSASMDAFVRLWYRAVTAHFEAASLLGNAKYQMDRALEVLPRDPMILFYAGTLHEANAWAGIQSIRITSPEREPVPFPSPQEEWRRAEPLLRAAIKENGPIEARVRLARVLGRMGKHAEAASMLRAVAPELSDLRLRYFGALFLGSEEGALGDVDRARDGFERAAALFPTAQSPLLALSELFQRTGNRDSALDALRRLQALPADSRQRVDPWLDYFRSFAFDADEQLRAARAWVDRKERP